MSRSTFDVASEIASDIVVAEREAEMPKRRRKMEAILAVVGDWTILNCEKVLRDDKRTFQVMYKKLGCSREVRGRGTGKM